MNGVLSFLSKQRLEKGHAVNDLTFFDPRIQAKSDLSHTDKMESTFMNSL